VAEVVVCKGADGKLSGVGEKGERALARLRSSIAKLSFGDTLSFQWWEPRSPKFHRRFFAKLNSLFERQEQFDDVDMLRAWLTVGAGECNFVPGPRGRMVALPKSIKWHKLDDVDFAELVRKIDWFLWTEHAQHFLWPHLSKEDAYKMIESLNQEFS
jgi:hypothetical protein